MKTKHILMSLALSATFAACSNEELINPGSLDQAKNELIELPDGFLLSGTRGGDAATRGAWEYSAATEYALKYAWMPTKELVGSDYKYHPDMIGLSWTGVNGTVGISAPTDMVHSNYKFTHYAWGINGVVAEYDKCAMAYDPATVKALASNTDTEALREPSDGSIYYQNTTSTNEITWPTYSIVDNDADITTGFFNTENSTVYAGQYIVYAPFDKDNVSNYVTATSKASFTKTATNVTKELAFKDLNNEIFMYGQTVIEKGGIQAGSFAANNLSGFILLKVSGTMADLRKVILYDAEGKFLTKVGLSAKGIISGQTGTSLYLPDAAVKKENSKFITVEFGSDVNLSSSAAYIAIPVLPTETAIENLTVVCINKDGLAVDRTISGSMTIPANGYASVNGGNAQWFEITNVNNGEYKVATDATSLKAAIINSNSNLENINIMGDIALTESLSIEGKYVLGVVKAGKIIIPGAKSSQISLTVKNEGTLDVDVDVKENCCAAHPGKLIIENATISANSTINVFADEDEKTTTDDGQVVFETGSTDINNTVKGTINNAGYLVIGKTAAAKKTTVTLDGGKIVNSGTMSILRSSSSTAGTNEFDGNLSLKNNSGAVLTNSGAIYVEGELSNYGTATNTGIIYDRVSAQVTGNRNITGGGDYICDVNDNGIRFDVALNERPAVTVVRFVEKTMSYPLTKLSGYTYTANVKRYIVDAGASNSVTFQSTVGTAASTATATVDVTIPALEVVTGTLKVSETVTASGNAPLHLTVTGNVSIAKDAKMELNDGRKRTEEMFRAGSLTVENGGELTVALNANAYVVGNVVVEGDKTGRGKIMFSNNTITDVHGDFINWGQVTITTGTGGASGTNVAGEVWVNDIANVKGGDTSDKTYYPAGTPVVRP